MTAGSRTGPNQKVPKPRVTIRDVALRVGVSTASVSYALSGSPEVGSDLRERVLHAAEELGYRPNKAAQQLRRGQTDAGRHCQSVLPGPCERCDCAAADKGFDVGERQSDAASAHLDRNSAGLLFTCVADPDHGLLRGLQSSGVPFVQLHRSLEGVSADSVVVDNFAAAKELAEHVTRFGRHRVAVLGGPEVSSVSRDRVRGFREGVGSGGAQTVNLEGIWGR